MSVFTLAHHKLGAVCLPEDLLVTGALSQGDNDQAWEGNPMMGYHGTVTHGTSQL